MFAEIYIVRRMARHLNFFDYKVNDLVPKVGDLVEINFKGRKTIGIVRGLKNKSDFDKCSNLIRIIDHQFEIEDIRRIEKLAFLNFISPSSIFYYIYNSAKYEKKTNSEVSDIFQTVSKTELEYNEKIINEYSNFEISMKNQVLSILNIIKKAENQVLIIIPNEVVKEVILNILNKVKLSFDVLYGQVNYLNLNRIKKNWKSGNNRILIGGKKAALLSAKKIDSIIVIDPKLDDYDIVDQNPSTGIIYSTKLLAEQHDAKLYKMGCSLGIDVKNTIFAEKFNFKLIELTKQGEYTELPLISKTSLTLAEKALQNGENVLFFLNRKGHAKHLKCTECHHIPFCGNCGDIPKVRKDDLLCENCSTEMWIPKNCPACQSEKLKKAGLGISEIESNLNNYFLKQKKDYSKKIKVVSEDGLRVEIYNFSKNKFGLVVDLLGDIHQVDSRFDSNEKAVYKLKRLCYFANDNNAECIIQTFSKNNIKRLLEKGFIEYELDLRKKLNLPPFSGIIEVNTKNQEFLDELNDKFEIEKIKDNKYQIIYKELEDIVEIVNKFPKEKVKNLTVNYENSSFAQSKS